MLAAELDRLADLESRHSDRKFDSLREAVLAGEPDGWKEFVEKYSRFVYTVSLQMMRGVAERDEAAAALYTRTFERLRSREYRLLRNFRGNCRFTTYLFRVVQSERKERFRRAAAEPETVSGESAGGLRAEVGPEPILRGEAIRQAVRAGIGELSLTQRLLLRCRFTDGLKLRELAETFGYNDTNEAARAVHRALSSLAPIKALEQTADLEPSERSMIADALAQELLDWKQRIEHE